jgi:hypothetical protein
MSDFLNAHPEPKLENLEEDLEEPEDYHAPFYEYVSASSTMPGSDRGIHTGICRLDAKGNHKTMSEHCPHFRTEDEEGKIVNPSWTAQSNRR